MAYRLGIVTGAILAAGAALAQQPTPLLPIPDQPAQTVPSGEPLSPTASPTTPPSPAAPPATPPPADNGPSRVFCGQTVTYHLADPGAVPEAYRQFIGLWSDAAWTPQLCAALIVESVAGNGTVTITYAFGPIGSGNQKTGGVLHGTGIVQDGELKFQNNDGSQFAFKPFYSDLVGHLATPKGDTYEAIFKKTF
jgi:hypothetical protein